jgi:glycine/D-amino acid oxidase-like deaminating enzyme
MESPASVVIIGGGIAGLTAAAYSARSGASSGPLPGWNAVAAASGATTHTWLSREDALLVRLDRLPLNRGTRGQVHNPCARVALKSHEAGVRPLTPRNTVTPGEMHIHRYA